MQSMTRLLQHAPKQPKNVMNMKIIPIIINAVPIGESSADRSSVGVADVTPELPKLPGIAEQNR